CRSHQSAISPGGPPSPQLGYAHRHSDVRLASSRPAGHAPSRSHRVESTAAGSQLLLWHTYARHYDTTTSAHMPGSVSSQQHIVSKLVTNYCRPGPLGVTG